jgi:hypothetical protein
MRITGCNEAEIEFIVVYFSIWLLPLEARSEEFCFSIWSLYLTEF